jgi:ferric-dicitrate binding protein FerR (iron transport regulator)
LIAGDCLHFFSVYQVVGEPIRQTIIDNFMDSKQFQYLVERYISEESTATEVEALRQLLQQPEYAAALDSIMDDQLVKSDVSANDYPEVVDRVKAAIAQKITVTPVRRLPLLRRWVAAASIILVAGIGAFFFFNKPSKQTNLTDTAASTKDIGPGKQGAILTLDDGRTVVLDSLGNGVVATQNGAKVLLKNGQLIYNKNESGVSQIAYNTMTTPRGRQFQLVLPDGTKVWLNAASSVRYPTAFTGKERKVEITGEAYFEVTKNEKMPFRVKVNDETEIEVLGTHFNINSYANESSINTTLLEGSVQVYNNGEKVVIRPGQQAQIAKESVAAMDKIHTRIKVVNAVDVEKVMAWKNGVFNFQDATLKEVMRQLERWYDIDVVYEKGVPDIEFMGKMERDLSLSDMLRGLKVSEVHFRMEEGRKLVITP